MRIADEALPGATIEFWGVAEGLAYHQAHKNMGADCASQHKKCRRKTNRAFMTKGTILLVLATRCTFFTNTHTHSFCTRAALLVVRQPPSSLGAAIWLCTPIMHSPVSALHLSCAVTHNTRSGQCPGCYAGMPRQYPTQLCIKAQPPGAKDKQQGYATMSTTQLCYPKVRVAGNSNSANFPVGHGLS